ncbi:STAS domain-containing protein [Microbispora rosea]|uniref:STAS domain-containing protein n=1 Tax=Microbispora rosea TaxID=58117 RepID=UPI003445CF74
MAEGRSFTSLEISIGRDLPSLLDAVERLWDHLREGCLILDLGPMRFCDSSGITQLIKVYRGCQEHGIRLSVAAPPAFFYACSTQPA